MNNKGEKKMNTHTEVAKHIRNIAKSLNIKTSVRSEVFAGGNAVRVQITNGEFKAIEWFKKNASQFATHRGRYNPIDDSSILDTRKDIPQVSFVTFWDRTKEI